MSDNLPTIDKLDHYSDGRILISEAHLEKLIAAERLKALRDSAKLVYQADTMQEAIDNIELEADQLTHQANGETV